MPGNLELIPPSVIAGWPKPDYNAKGRTWIVPYIGILQGVMTVMLGTRFWLRVRNQAGSLGLDDILLVPAFLAATMFTTLVIISTEKWGMNRHVYDVPFSTFEYTALGAWLGELAFIIATCSTKISVLLFYRRLTKGNYKRAWIYADIGAIIFTSLYCLSFILLLIFNCRPTEAYWKSYSPTYSAHYTCTSTQVANPISGVLSCVSDFYSVLLPMAMLWHLDAPKRQKFALNAVFALGLLVVAAGAVRTYYLTLLGRSYDITWIGYDVYVWSGLETHLAIICASAPALRVFFRKYLSNPVSRIVNSAKSVTSPRHTNRDSKAIDHGATMFSPRGQSVSAGLVLELGEKKHVYDHIKPILSTVGEKDTETPSPAINQLYVVRTPADFEEYALKNLEKNRPPYQPTFFRQSSDDEDDEMEDQLRPSLSGPFTDWHNPPTQGWR